MKEAYEQKSAAYDQAVAEIGQRGKGIAAWFTPAKGKEAKR